MISHFKPILLVISVFQVQSVVDDVTNSQTTPPPAECSPYLSDSNPGFIITLVPKVSTDQVNKLANDLKNNIIHHCGKIGHTYDMSDSKGFSFKMAEPKFQELTTAINAQHNGQYNIERDSEVGIYKL